MLRVENYSQHLDRVHKTQIEARHRSNNNKSEEVEILELIWDDIDFGKDCLKFKSSRLNKIIQPFPHEGLIEGLNLIKQEYFQKLVFKIAVSNGKIIPENSKGLNNLFDKIEVAKAYYSFKRPSQKNKFFTTEKLSNNDILDLFKEAFDKSEYIKYLAKKQRKNSLKLIPIIEYINNKYEEAFLFRYKVRQNSILLVWENVNDGRASHLFEYCISEEGKVLREIKYFVNRDDLINKRSGLHSQTAEVSQTKYALKYKGHIKHNSLKEYITKLDKIIC
ncbi:MAG TPA: hypothetical protein PLP23_00795 [Panacibacter sp.]|nr:hypothetical protein [Panacibacter sp.]